MDLMKNQTENLSSVGRKVRSESQTHERDTAISRYRSHMEDLNARFGGLVREEKQLHLSFFPGIHSLPVLPLFPGIFWNGEGLKRLYSFRNEVHEIIKGIYINFLAKGDPALEEGSPDRIALNFLYNYSIWTGKTSWIYSLALFLEQRGGDEDYPLTAAAVAAMEGRSILADYFYRKSKNRHPVLDAVYRIYRKRGWSASKMMEELNPWLGIIGATYRGDRSGEMKILEDLIKNASHSEETAIAIWGYMETRGYIYRLLHSSGRRILALSEEFQSGRVRYLMAGNGKPIQHIDKKVGSIPPDWYTSVFLILTGVERGLKKQYLQRNDEYFQSNYAASLAPAEEREDFLAAITSGKSNGLTNLSHGAASILEAVAFLNKIDGKNTIRKFRKTFGDLRFAVRASTLRLIAGRQIYHTEDVIQKSDLPYLISLAGRISALRSFLGVYLTDHPDAGDPMPFLLKADRWHPAVNHCLAMIYFAEGSYEKAASLYNVIVQKIPDSPVFWHNYGKILERMGKQSEAGNAFSTEKKLSMST